jgi:hypothetical protein
MMPPTFDERASTLTKSLLADAQRIPARLRDERTKTAPWKAVAVFAASVIVIGGAVAGVSIALHRASLATSAPASQSGHWKAFALQGVVGGLSGIGCLDSGYCVAVTERWSLATRPSAKSAADMLSGGSVTSPQRCLERLPR